jgi:hypothetical protein
MSFRPSLTDVAMEHIVDGHRLTAGFRHSAMLAYLELQARRGAQTSQIESRSALDADFSASARGETPPADVRAPAIVEAEIIPVGNVAERPAEELVNTR